MTGADLLVGLDIGTTSSKAVVFTNAGEPVAIGRADTEWTRSTAGTEITAEQLRDAAFLALSRAVDASPPGRIAGVGIASIAESGVLLDDGGRSIAPVIAWHDRRDGEELEQLTRTIDPVRFRSTTGLPLRQQWSLTKNRWIARHVPRAAAATMRLNVAEWVAFALGARPSTEPSLASRTGWFDIHTGSWWDEGMEFARVSADTLPELEPCGTDLGCITADVHPRLLGAHITIAGHDHQAAAVGFGAYNPGDVLDSCGTAEALVRTAVPPVAPETVDALAAGGVTTGWHVLPGRWCLLGATEGGLMLGRILRALGVDDFASGLDKAARALTSPSVDVAVDDTGRAAIQAIGDDASPAHIWRAAVERATADADILAQLIADATGPNTRVVAAGGWTASAALIDAKRRAWGAVTVPAQAEAGARGAAVFAGVASGSWGNVDSAFGAAHR
ncbi:MAG: FGGY-family carbohydrate kinase [Microbacterium sp.]